MNKYSPIGAVGATSGNYTLTGSGNMNVPYSFDINTITLPGMERLEMKSSVTFSLVKAVGGTIVVCKRDPGVEPEYYVIPEGVRNFDKELGKIISIFMLKG